MHRVAYRLKLPKRKLMSKLTHFNSSGEAHMVDVGSKSVTHRRAVAEGFITMQPETLKIIMGGHSKKGDVLGIARIAGIMAAKKTSDLVPLCHPLALTHIDISLNPEVESNRIHCLVTVETDGKTGVEMEALTATQICLLTIYDMCKAVDRAMIMEGIGLVEKSGGKSGHWKKST